MDATTLDCIRDAKDSIQQAVSKLSLSLMYIYDENKRREIETVRDWLNNEYDSLLRIIEREKRA